MIVRLGLNAAAHVAAGVAMGVLAVMAAAYVMEQQRRREATPAATGGGAEPKGTAEGDPGAV